MTIFAQFSKRTAPRGPGNFGAKPRHGDALNKKDAMDRKIKGTMLGAAAAATYGMNPLFALPLYQAGLGVDSVLFYRYSMAIVILAVIMKLRGESFAITRRELLPLIVMGLLFSLSSFFLFSSYNYMDAGIASTMLFVYPVMVAVIMALCFHEALSAVTVISIVLALSGIALLYRGGDGAALNLTGMLLVMLSALAYAIYIVGVTRSSIASFPSLKLTFYVLLFGFSIYLVRLDFGTALQVVPRPWLWLDAAALALLPTVLSLMATNLSAQYIGPTPTAILGALEPVTAVFFGVLIFGERLSPRLLGGILLVIMAVMLIVAGKPLAHKLHHLHLPHRHRI